MNREDFRFRLDDAVNSLVKFTQNYCHNNFAKSYIYKLEPSEKYYHVNMDEFAKKVLDAMLNIDKTLTQEQLLDLLYIDDKIPNWINIQICESLPERTVIQVTATREWRAYKQAINDSDKWEIFHKLVALPPGYNQDAFDINWQVKNND